jgi:phosphoribosylamine-glycine ligase
MYIYNVTINIELSIHDTWLQWMKSEHIPAMLATKKFSKALMTKVLFEQEMDGVTYSVQYTTDSKETLNRYFTEDSERLRELSQPFTVRGNR